MRIGPVLAAAALVLAGCSASPAPTTASPTPDLTALHEQFGLPACPETDPAAAAVDGGLPQTDLACLGTEQRVNLAGLARTPTIVNLWAQWCGPCREESPFLREGSAQLGSVAFVGINYNDPKPDWAIEFAGLAGWHYPHVQDEEKALQADLKVPGLPTTYFVAADGTIAYVHAGPFESTQQLVELAQQHLGVS